MNTATTAPVITEALGVATEYGARPFAGYVTTSANRWGGIDIRNANSGQTFRIMEDDSLVTLHLFVGGTSMLLSGTQTFSGCFSNAATVGAALASLL